MATLTTNGIKVSITTHYQSEYSKPIDARYIFAYKVIIENLSFTPIQLLRRQWTIVDSDGLVRVIEGEGVIGKQPIIPPGESHQYVSWSNLHTGLGKMFGKFTVRDLDDRQLFDVDIPTFQLVAPSVLN